MMKRFGSGRIGGNEKGFDSEVNPMDGLANLADVMLVFACGIMLALIINWNVDVGSFISDSVQMEKGQEVSDVENLGEGEGILSEDGQYEEMGVVYKDPVTGNLYMVEKTDK